MEVSYNWCLSFFQPGNSEVQGRLKPGLDECFMDVLSISNGILGCLQGVAEGYGAMFSV